MDARRLMIMVIAILALVTSIGLPWTVRASEVELDTIRFDGGMVNDFYLKDGKGWVIVDYTKFKINLDTDIRGMLDIGTFVDVRAERHDDFLLATRITVLDEATDMVKFDGGTITKINLMMYKVKVEGTKFITTGDTELDEGLMVGDAVRVEALRHHGKLIATRITLIDSVLE